MNNPDTYRPRILRYITRLVGQTETEDLTNEVMTLAGELFGAAKGPIGPRLRLEWAGGLWVGVALRFGID